MYIFLFAFKLYRLSQLHLNELLHKSAAGQTLVVLTQLVKNTKYILHIVGIYDNRIIYNCQLTCMSNVGTANFSMKVSLAVFLMQCCSKCFEHILERLVGTQFCFPVATIHLFRVSSSFGKLEKSKHLKFPKRGVIFFLFLGIPKSNYKPTDNDGTSMLSWLL